MKNLLKMFVFAVLFTAAATAQEQMSGISWNIGLPAGRMNSYMDKTSYGGFGFQASKFVQEDVAVGLNLSWNIWSDLTDQIIPLSNGAISGTQIRYYNVFPILVNAHYFFSDRRETFRPYAGINVGTYYVRQRLDIGVYTLENDNWHFALAPEAGFMAEVSNNTFINVTTRYNYAFDSGQTLGGNDDNSLVYWGINVGVMWSTGLF